MAIEDVIKLAAEAGTVIQAIHSFDLASPASLTKFCVSPVLRISVVVFTGILFEPRFWQVRERLGHAWPSVRCNACSPNDRLLVDSKLNATHSLGLQPEKHPESGSWLGLESGRILDWEFAISGSPLVDIGNFLRFEDELPPGFIKAFVRG